MKKIFLILTISLSLFAEIKWLNLNDGLEMAKKDNKLVLIMMTSPSCGYCVKMDREVLTQKKVIDTLNNFFIPVKIDVSKDDYPDTLRVRGTPTFFFATKDKVIVNDIVGYRESDEFLSALSKTMMMRVE